MIGFAIGNFFGVLLSPVIFTISFFKAARAFHAQGTMCRAKIVALDDVVGPRLEGNATIRLSGSAKPENSPEQSILGMAMKFGGTQDLPIATFESFLKAKQATANTDVKDYLANQYSSVTPWKVEGLDGSIWFRAMPKTSIVAGALRTERLAAHIAEGNAVFVLEARSAPGPDAPVVKALAEIQLVDVLRGDDSSFDMSMTRNGLGIRPLGIRNGIRRIVYPVSQYARGLKGA
jgi:hypothetical protein